MPGTVEHVHVAPEGGAPMQRVESVAAVAGRGLRGDRYFEGTSTFDADADSAITLFAAETLDAVERDYGLALGPADHRRNVTTRGVALNHLVGRRFRVGTAVCEGVELAEPCNYLEDQVGSASVRESLVHRGGLRGRIVESGEIVTGDDVAVL